MFVRQGQTSGFQTILPKHDETGPGPPIVLLQPLGYGIPSLSFGIDVSDFSEGLELMFEKVSSVAT